MSTTIVQKDWERLREIRADMNHEIWIKGSNRGGFNLLRPRPYAASRHTYWGLVKRR